MARAVPLIRILSPRDTKAARRGETFFYGEKALETVRDNLGAIRSAQANVYPGKDRIQFTISAAFISFISYVFVGEEGVTYETLFKDWITPICSMKIGYYFLVLMSAYVLLRSLTYIVLAKALANAESFYVESLGKVHLDQPIDAPAEQNHQRGIKNANSFDCAVDFFFHLIVIYVSIEMFHIFTF